jgi:hypothetical protein
MTDEAATPAHDPELWVEAHGFDGRCFLLGNPHTHLGRMVVWVESLRDVAYISKYDVENASEAARRWIEGFLHGNEPSPAEYLGIDPRAEADLDDGDPGLARWQAALVEFHQKGTMPSLVPVPSVNFPLDEIHGQVPWTWAGGQVWIWRDASWHVAEPQPELEGTSLAGSVCAIRGYHDLTAEVGGRHVACIDCGYAEETGG